MRKKDWADEEADRLFDLVRDAESDESVTDAIAASLRLALSAGSTKLRLAFRALLDIQ